MDKQEIKDLRKEKGWTQEDLAQKIGVTLRAVKSWEKGDRKPSVQAKKLLNIYKII